MLNGRLPLHDIRDTEAFCRKLVSEKWDLKPHERDDLLAFLVATCWELSLKYDHGDPQYPPRFSVYATNILRSRAVDWYRSERGRTRWVFKDRTIDRPNPEIVSLGGVDGVELEFAVDGAADSSPDLGRFLRQVPGEVQEGHGRNGSRMDGGPKGRDRRAA